jgi:methionyl aminopeptidase
MIEIYGGRDLDKLRRAGQVAADTLRHVASLIRPGITTLQIDQWVREDTARRGGSPSQLGFHGFPAAVCTSRNNVVCHGIPNAREVVRDGDILNIDVTTELDGFHGDTSCTLLIGQVSPEAARLVAAAERARDAGIQVIREGARLGDIAGAIGEVARGAGCSVVAELCGHGIGRAMHAEPQVPHVGKAGTGLRLKAGMVITVEPMLNLGGPGVVFNDDGWTVTTRDGSLSAQFEHTVLVTRGGFEILTQPSVVPQ